MARDRFDLRNVVFTRRMAEYQSDLVPQRARKRSVNPYLGKSRTVVGGDRDRSRRGWLRARAPPLRGR